MRWRREFITRFSGRTLLLFGALFMVVALVIIYGIGGNSDPLPPQIKSQLAFPAIYPKDSGGSVLDRGAIAYQPANKTLSLSDQAEGTDIILTEQAAAGASSNASVVYYQSLGLHPVSEIQTKLGLAILVNFYTVGDFNSAGQNAVLADDGTLLIAHPTKNISAEAWKNFLDSLNLDK